MTKIQALVVPAALAIAMAVPASAATTDPEVIIYRFPGVRDEGAGNQVGIATVIFCTNFSGATETIRFATRTDQGTLVFNNTLNISHLVTLTVYTHTPAAYAGFTMNTGLLNSGTTAIAATSTNIICSAMTIDAANPKPDGVALRGIRFAPVPGSQE